MAVTWRYAILDVHRYVLRDLTAYAKYIKLRKYTGLRRNWIQPDSTGSDTQDQKTLAWTTNSPTILRLVQSSSSKSSTLNVWEVAGVGDGVGGATKIGGAAARR